MNDLQVADERAVENHLRDLAASEDIERIRATLDLASIDPEEARATFGEPPASEDVPIAGVDVDPVIGPMLIRYCPRRGLVLVRAARIPRAAALYDPSPEALQSGYADAKRVFARALASPEYARRHGWGTDPHRIAGGGGPTLGSSA